jgi:hypothetical protein
MKLKLPITFLLCKCILLSSVYANDNYLSFEDHVLTSFKDSVACVKQVGITGPLAEEVTRWAIVRQLHENGLDRPATYCIPGIGCGGWNEENLKWSLKRIPNDIQLSRIRDSEGAPMYVLKGNKANLISTATVALLFDYYVNKFSWFSQKEKEAWAESKKYSYLIAQGFDLPQYHEAFNKLKPEREKILRKCNGGYGPGRDRIRGEVKRLDGIFNQVLDNCR